MKDHIVEEVRAIREEIAREHDYDLDEIFAMLRASAEKSGRSHASPEPAKVDATGRAAQHTP